MNDMVRADHVARAREQGCERCGCDYGNMGTLALRYGVGRGKGPTRSKNGRVKADNREGEHDYDM